MDLATFIRQAQHKLTHIIRIICRLLKTFYIIKKHKVIIKYKTPVKFQRHIISETLQDIL